MPDLPEKPLTIADTGGCTCMRWNGTEHVYEGECRYHAAAKQQPWNHRIPWNCPTYWDGCNCEGGPYFYTEEADA